MLIGQTKKPYFPVASLTLAQNFYTNFRVNKFPPGSIEVKHWKYKIQHADANQQKQLFVRTDHQTLSINENQFLAILKEIQPFINEEPALSVYWKKRDQQEDALRQERQG